jgi:hypothetical protein
VLFVSLGMAFLHEPPCLFAAMTLAVTLLPTLFSDAYVLRPRKAILGLVMGSGLLAVFTVCCRDYGRVLSLPRRGVSKLFLSFLREYLGVCRMRVRPCSCSRCSDPESPSDGLSRRALLSPAFLPVLLLHWHPI